MHIDDLRACGLSDVQAAALWPRIDKAMALPPAERFLELARNVLTPDQPFALHQLLYKTHSADGIVWAPSKDDVEQAHATQLMREGRFDSHEALHAWSATERPAFWQRVVEKLSIRFQILSAQVVDAEADPSSVHFFPGSRLNIAESCFGAARSAPAIVYQREGGKLQSIRYGELLRTTRQVAASLRIMGLQPGARIAIDMPMTAESIAIYLGIVWAGCSVIAIADSFAAEEIATRLTLGQAQLIFTQDVIVRGGKALPLYERVVAAGSPPAVVVAEGQAGLNVSLRRGDISWDEFIGKEEIDAELCAPTTHSNVLFSSGTTGTPKAIPWNHITPIKCAADGYLHHDIHPGEVVAWPTNLGWMMGPWLIYASLINRATIALYYGAPTGADFLRFVQNAQVNMLGVVPSLVRTWRATDALRGLNFGALRALSSTGECSNPDDMHWLMAQVGYRPVLEYCGGTELAGGYLAGSMLQAARPACFTTPALGLDMVILDEEGAESDSGEAFLLPPSVGMSTELLGGEHHAVYYEDVPTYRGKRMRRHGDRVERIGPAHYRVHGRADDAMNLGGIKVSSAEIERVLNAIDGVGETAAIAVAPSAGGPSQLVVYAVLDRPIDDLIIALQTTLRSQLNPLFKIADVVTVDALPRTASNKVMRRVLRDQYTLR